MGYENLPARVLNEKDNIANPIIQNTKPVSLGQDDLILHNGFLLFDEELDNLFFQLRLVDIVGIHSIPEKN